MESTDWPSSSSLERGTGVPYTLLLVCSAGLSRSQVFVDFSPSYDRKPHPNPKLEESIDEVWKQRILVNPSLYNATKFRYGGCRIHLLGGNAIQEASICLCLGLTDYRTFVGTNLSPGWEQYLVPVEDDVERCQHTSSPLGNGAVVETIDDFVLVLQRSYNVGEFPGHPVFPGGHSEPQEIGVSGHIYDENKTFRENMNSKIAQEMFDGITREVVEEIGVPASSLRLIFLGHAFGILSIHIKLKMPPTKEELQFKGKNIF